MAEEKNWVRLMLDSGAFTVWRQGEDIDLDAYIGYIQEKAHRLSSYVSLDVMPGRPGENRTPAQTEAAAKASYRNAVKMRKAGLNPVPVFHMGERWYWLEKMIGEGFDYVGLGGMALAGRGRRSWIAEAFTHLCGTSGFPCVKVHGFGVTSVNEMLDFPWYSVDSVTWMKQGVMGSVYVPRSDGAGGYDYHLPPYAIAISKPGRKGPSATALGNATHYDSVGKATRAYLDDYFEAEGLAVDELAGEYKKRIRLNARFFRNFSRSYAHRPFDPIGNRGLVPMVPMTDGSIYPPPKFHLIFSVGTYLEYANILREEGCRRQLVSYHRIVHGAPFDLDAFVTSGWFVRTNRKDGAIIV